MCICVCVGVCERMWVWAWVCVGVTCKLLGGASHDSTPIKRTSHIAGSNSCTIPATAQVIEDVLRLGREGEESYIREIRRVIYTK